MTMAALARLQSIGKQYDRSGWALRDVELDVCPGEILGIIGANGSGKSTLLRILSGQSPASSGGVMLFERPVGHFRSSELRRNLGLVTQDQALDPEMTTLETLRFFAALYGYSAADARRHIERVVEGFDLSAILPHRLARASGGQRQRVHLAVGLLQRPMLLLFDEPSNSLDPLGRSQFWTVLQEFRGTDRAAVVATHHLDEVEMHCDRVAVLSAGKLLDTASPAMLRQKTGSADLEQAFFALTGEKLSEAGADTHVTGGKRRRGTGRMHRR